MAGYLSFINTNEVLYPNNRMLAASFIPAHWARGSYQVEGNIGWHENNLLETWIYRNLTGGWTYHVDNKSGVSVVHLAFENPHDKFMFELGGGIELLKVK